MGGNWTCCQFEDKSRVQVNAAFISFGTQGKECVKPAVVRGNYAGPVRGTDNREDHAIQHSGVGAPVLGSGEWVGVRKCRQVWVRVCVYGRECACEDTEEREKTHN